MRKENGYDKRPVGEAPQISWRIYRREVLERQTKSAMLTKLGLVIARDLGGVFVAVTAYRCPQIRELLTERKLQFGQIA